MAWGGTAGVRSASFLTPVLFPMPPPGGVGVSGLCALRDVKRYSLLERGSESGTSCPIWFTAVLEGPSWMSIQPSARGRCGRGRLEGETWCPVCNVTNPLPSLGSPRLAGGSWTPSHTGFLFNNEDKSREWGGCLLPLVELWNMPPLSPPRSPLPHSPKSQPSRAQKRAPQDSNIYKLRYK